MKIKTCSKPYEEVMQLPRPEHIRPLKPSRVLGRLVRTLAGPELKKVDFTYEEKNMERAGDGPWLILMNHSSFLDLMIASRILYPRLYNIVCTSDGLVGKEGIMRRLGCIPTQKFVSDIALIGDLKHALQVNKTSVLMYPEASYSFDGTATPLPRKMGVLFKGLRVPVVMITTYGSFARDPLYNNLQKRDVKVSAAIECLLTPEEIKEKSVAEIDQILDQAFSFDYFRWQKENNVVIDEPFRADDLNRILFRCPCCKTEGKMLGKGTTIRCEACGREYLLREDGQLEAVSDGASKQNANDQPKAVKNSSLSELQESDKGVTPAEFPHIPDWYAWERQTIREEVLAGTYHLDTDVEIGLIVDFKSLYMVGEGKLHHDSKGFILDGCDGKLHYEQGPAHCYSLYSDYYWYEIGDVICIGDKNCLYYCFPKQKDVAARTRIAAEEIYKLNQKRKRK